MNDRKSFRRYDVQLIRKSIGSFRRRTGALVRKFLGSPKSRRRIFDSSGLRPKIFQFWDRTPPREITRLIKTWKAEEPSFHHQLFDDGSALKLITEEIGPDAAAAFQECNVPAMRADFFRYCALWLHGGIYIDADTANLGGLPALYEKADRGLLFFRKGRVANDFMIVKAARDPLMRYALDTAISNINSRISNNVWIVTGPGILTSLHRSSNDKSAELFQGYTFIDISELKNTVSFAWGLEYKKQNTHWTNYKDAPGSPSIFVSEAAKQ